MRSYKLRILPVKSMHYAMFAALLLAISFVAPPAQSADKVIARVNGSDITDAEIKLAENDLGPELANIPAGQRQMVLLEYVIENQILAAAAQVQELHSDENFKNRLKYYTRRALRDAFYEKNIRSTVTEADAKKLYDSQVKSIKPETELRARHILLKTEKEAKDVVKSLAGGAKFADLAKKKSTGPSGPRGGDLGYFTRGRMVKEFETVAFSLKKGEVSQPVKTQFGWHVIKIEDIRKRQAPKFEVLKDRIMASLVQRKTQQVVGSLRSKAKVEVLDPVLKKQHDAIRARIESQLKAKEKAAEKKK